MAAASLLTAAVTASHAAPTVMSDAGLDTITGKAGNLVTSSSLDISTAFTGADNSANIQWGFYQWYDNHSADKSQVKGGNQFDGASSEVQAKVVEQNNAIFWGGLGQNSLTTSAIGSGGSNMAYGTFAAGGF
jgi:hypothetical protein